MAQSHDDTFPEIHSGGQTRNRAEGATEVTSELPAIHATHETVERDNVEVTGG
jgi:hypothetical protein